MEEINLNNDEVVGKKLLVKKRRGAWTAASQTPDTPTPSWEGVKLSNKTAR